MDTDAGYMDIPVMRSNEGFRSGHFRERADYATRRPAGGPDWLLVVTIRGAGIHRRGRQTVRIPEGAAVLYAPGVPQHYGTHPSDRHWELIWAHFPDNGRLHSLLAWPGNGDDAGVLELGEACAPVTDAMRELVEWQSGGSVRRHEFAANALERVLLWCDTVNPRNPRNSMDSRVAQALQIVTAQLREPLTIGSVAGELGISGSRLSHLFRRDVGASFPEYVEGRRMEYAEDLLRMTDRPIAAVARGVGYEDPLYFSRRFSARTGLSPRAWRARTRGATG